MVVGPPGTGKTATAVQALFAVQVLFELFFKAFLHLQVLLLGGKFALPQFSGSEDSLGGPLQPSLE